MPELEKKTRKSVIKAVQDHITDTEIRLDKLLAQVRALTDKS